LVKQKGERVAGASDSLRVAASASHCRRRQLAHSLVDLALRGAA
jgi:hypothetical protein